MYFNGPKHSYPRGFVILLSLFLIAFLAGCGGGGSSDGDNGEDDTVSPEVQAAFEAAEDDEMTASLRGLSGSIAGLRNRLEIAFPEVTELIEGDGGTEKLLLYELSEGAFDANDDTRFMIYAYALEKRGNSSISNSLRDILYYELDGPLQKTPHFLAEAISVLEGLTPSPFAYYSTVEMLIMTDSLDSSSVPLTQQPLAVEESRKGSCGRQYLLADSDDNPLLDNTGNPIAVFGREYAEDNMTELRKNEWIEKVTSGGGTYVHDNPLFPGTPTWRFNCAGYVFRDFNGGKPWTASVPNMFDAMMRAGLLKEITSDSDTLPGDIVFYYQPDSSKAGHVAEVARVEVGFLTTSITVRNADDRTGLWEADIDASYFFGSWSHFDYKYKTRRIFRIVRDDDDVSDDLPGDLPPVIKDASITGDPHFCVDGTDTPEPDGDTEYVVWYMDNVRCWDAPRVYATHRDSFDLEEDTCDIPGGGINCDIKVEKVEMQGGFSTLEAAQNWFCPQITTEWYHYWCNDRGPRVEISGGDLYTLQIPCDLTDVPYEYP